MPYIDVEGWYFRNKATLHAGRYRSGTCGFTRERAHTRVSKVPRLDPAGRVRPNCRVINLGTNLFEGAKESGVAWLNFSTISRVISSVTVLFEDIALT